MSSRDLTYEWDAAFDLPRGLLVREIDVCIIRDLQANDGSQHILFSLRRCGLKRDGAHALIVSELMACSCARIFNGPASAKEQEGCNERHRSDVYADCSGVSGGDHSGLGMNRLCGGSSQKEVSLSPQLAGTESTPMDRCPSCSEAELKVLLRPRWDLATL